MAKDGRNFIQSVTFGLILIIIGLAFIVFKFIPGFGMDILWPLFLLVPILILVFAWVNGRRDAEGTVVPIVILTYLMVFFIWLNMNGWESLATLWPHFLLAPAAGLLGLFLIQHKPGVLVPVVVLGATGLIFLQFASPNKLVIAALIIALGIILLVDAVIQGVKRSVMWHKYKKDDSTHGTEDQHIDSK